MTELEQLQQQIEELKKTVDDLKSGTVKVANMKDVLSEKECAIFWKYFKKLNYNDPKFVVQSKSTPGLAFSYGSKVSNNTDGVRRSIRDTARGVYRFNVFNDLISAGNYEQLFYKIIKNDEQLNEYLDIFENICRFTVTQLNEDFKNQEE